MKNNSLRFPRRCAPQNKSRARSCLARSLSYAPLTAVAGDFYDFLSTEPGSLGIVVADVTGHGVPAALVASMIKVAVSTQLSNATAPDRVLAGINTVLCRQAPGQYATAVYCYYEERLHLLRYSAAGHPPPLLWRHGTRQLRRLEEGGLLIGVRPDEVYPRGRDRVAAGRPSAAVYRWRPGSDQRRWPGIRRIALAERHRNEFGTLGRALLAPAARRSTLLVRPQPSIHAIR